MTFFEKREAELEPIVITDVEQIATLPWFGNHAADAMLFRKIDAFVRQQTNREVQRRALYLSALHGMGIDEPVTDEGLEAYLNDN